MTPVRWLLQERCFFLLPSYRRVSFFEGNLDLARFIKAAKPLEFHQYLDPFWGQNLTGGLFRKMYGGQICNLVGARLVVDDGEVWWEVW